MALRPTAAKVKKLPPLRVEIIRDGKRVRIAKIPDPRAVFCQHYNALCLDTTARPL